MRDACRGKKDKGEQEASSPLQHGQQVVCTMVRIKLLVSFRFSLLCPLQEPVCCKGQPEGKFGHRSYEQERRKLCQPYDPVFLFTSYQFLDLY